MRIGVFLPNWVGDMVMATPALRALSHYYQGRARLLGILRPYVKDVLAGTPWLDELVVYDRRSKRSMLGLVRQLRRRQIDTVLLLSNSLTTATLAWLSGAPRRIGFAMHGRGWLLSDPLQPVTDGGVIVPRSAVDHYLDVVSVLGCQTRDKTPTLATLPEDELQAARLWDQFGWARTDPVIVCNSGAAYGAAKTWPGAHFQELATRLVQHSGVRVLFLCGPTEREQVWTLCRNLDDPRIQSLADQPLSIGLSKAVVRRARMMVTTDSGPRHLAAAFGVPTVTIYGPTDPRWSVNYHPASLDLQLDVPCGPCGKRVCPQQHHRCMRELSVDHVLAAATGILEMTHRHVA